MNDADIIHAPAQDAAGAGFPEAAVPAEAAPQAEPERGGEAAPADALVAAEPPVEHALAEASEDVASEVTAAWTVPTGAVEAPADAAAEAVAEADHTDVVVATEAAQHVASELAPTVEHVEPAPVAEGTPAVAPAQPPKDPKVEERRRRAQQAWERVVAARESGETVTGTVTAVVKGGLLVDVGSIRGFLPASQTRVPLGTALDTLVKAKIPLKIIDIDQGKRRIVVSHRRAVEEERRAQRAELLRSLQVGQTREGTVVRLADFGAFVDLGGIDGLIPMRELAFERVEKAGDVVKVGEKLPVTVMRIEENGKKISLSRKNALSDPWRDHTAKLRPGTTVEGKVVAKEPGLQVEIAEGVVGIVRESDANPADYEIGEAIEVAVRYVDRAKRRIVLTTLHGASAAPPPPTSSGFAPLGVELKQRR